VDDGYFQSLARILAELRTLGISPGRDSAEQELGQVVLSLLRAVQAPDSQRILHEQLVVAFEDGMRAGEGLARAAPSERAMWESESQAASARIAAAGEALIEAAARVGFPLEAALQEVSGATSPSGSDYRVVTPTVGDWEANLREMLEHAHHPDPETVIRELRERFGWR
jgi:hypothetical protein